MVIENKQSYKNCNECYDSNIKCDECKHFSDERHYMEKTASIDIRDEKPDIAKAQLLFFIDELIKEGIDRISITVKGTTKKKYMIERLYFDEKGEFVTKEFLEVKQK